MTNTTCQRHKMRFSPIPYRECDHLADFEMRHMPSGQRVIICGCCFLELGQHTGAIFVQMVVDLRTGMALPPLAAKDRAARLN